MVKDSGDRREFETGAVRDMAEGKGRGVNMSRNYELELYKLINDEELVSEFGWCSDDSCCVWVDYRDLDEFMRKVIEIFGYGMFDDGGFNANMQGDGVCLDLCEMVGGYMDVRDVFPKEKYKH